jgi:adenylosuccinate synthase
MTWNGIYVVTDPTWGDNGKGKIVDLLSDRAEMSIRYNGGPNAGHTVRNEHGEFKFHLMPSAIFNPKALCILADAVVIDPKNFLGNI